MQELVDLHVGVPVVAVPYLAALAEQVIRLVEQEDPPALLDRSGPHVLLCELRVLSQDLALECVALLTTHRSNVERIVQSGDILDRLFRPAMHPRDPGVGSTVGAVWVIRPRKGSRPLEPDYRGTGPGDHQRARLPLSCEPDDPNRATVGLGGIWLSSVTARARRQARAP
jgi:hypothetical protein